MVATFQEKPGIRKSRGIRKWSVSQGNVWTWKSIEILTLNNLVELLDLLYRLFNFSQLEFRWHSQFLTNKVFGVVAAIK